MLQHKINQLIVTPFVLCRPVAHKAPHFYAAGHARRSHISDKCDQLSAAGGVSRYKMTVGSTPLLRINSRVRDVPQAGL
jgi:hypothetical protein